MEEIIEQVLDVKIRVVTNNGDEKIICLTEFFEPQDVNITYDNDKVVLTIKKNKENCTTYRLEPLAEDDVIAESDIDVWELLDKK